jgi:hypothetical protein
MCAVTLLLAPSSKWKSITAVNQRPRRSKRGCVAPGYRSQKLLRAAGRDHTCALHGNGRVSCWGRNLLGQLGDGSADEPSEPGEVDTTKSSGAGGSTGLERRAAGVLMVSAAKGRFLMNGEEEESAFPALDATHPERWGGVAGAVDRGAVVVKVPQFALGAHGGRLGEPSGVRRRVTRAAGQSASAR